jgi:hypothetical protein
MVANFWDIWGLFGYLFQTDLNFFLSGMIIFCLLTPFMIYKIASTYIILFDFKFFGLYGVKANNQSDEMSILNVSSLFSLFTLPIVNSFYIISLDSNQLAKTTYSTSLKFLSYPMVGNKSIIFYINLAIIVIIVVIAIVTSKKGVERLGLAKYSEQGSVTNEELAVYKAKITLQKKKYIEKIIYYYHVISINQQPNDVYEHVWS